MRSEGDERERHRERERERETNRGREIKIDKQREIYIIRNNRAKK